MCVWGRSEQHQQAEECWHCWLSTGSGMRNKQRRHRSPVEAERPEVVGRSGRALVAVGESGGLAVDGRQVHAGLFWGAAGSGRGRESGMRAASRMPTGCCTATAVPARAAFQLDEERSTTASHLDHLQHRGAEHGDAGARVLAGGEAAGRAGAAGQVGHGVREELIQHSAPLDKKERRRWRERRRCLRLEQSDAHARGSRELPKQPRHRCLLPPSGRTWAGCAWKAATSRRTAFSCSSGCPSTPRLVSAARSSGSSCGPDTRTVRSRSASRPSAACVRSSSGRMAGGILRWGGGGGSAGGCRSAAGT